MSEDPQANRYGLPSMRADLPTQIRDIVSPVLIPIQDVVRRATAGIETRMLTNMDKLPRLAMRGAFKIMESRGRPVIASINVVNECNLHCAGCYWGLTEAKEERAELNAEESVELIDGLWERGVRDFLLLGGEPLMRLTPEEKAANPERMEPRERTELMARRVAELGGITTVITNATYGIPALGEWPRTHYFVSFDGDEHGMGRVRGAGVFEKAREAVQGRQDVVLAMTISDENAKGIEQFVKNAKEWEVGGVVFYFASPQVRREGRPIPKFYLTGERKSEAAERLLALRGAYGDFITMSDRTIELLGKPEEWSPECPTFFAQSIRADGKPIERCVFGPQGDCDNCGCNISAAAVAIREGDRETARMTALPAKLAGIQ